jgi:hypothetical protein
MPTTGSWTLRTLDPRSSEKLSFQDDIAEAFKPIEDTVKTVGDWLTTTSGIAKDRLTLARGQQTMVRI